MVGALEQFCRRADLYHCPLIHHHHLVGEGQGFGLVMGDIDHGVAELLMQGLELRAQLPFHMRVDHGQRLVEQDGIHILAHHAAPQADLLLGIRRQPARLGIQPVGHADHGGNRLDPRLDIGRIRAAILQRKGQVLPHRHGVIDNRELKHLSDVARGGRGQGHVRVAKQYPAFGGLQQTGNDVEQGGFAASRRAKQGIGRAIVPDMVDSAQGVVGGGLRR